MKRPGRRPGGVPCALSAVACALASAAAAPSALRAQAWLSEKGTFSYTIGYGDVFNEMHYLPTGAEVDVGHTRIRSLALGLTYTFTDRFEVSAGIPLVSSEYHGHRPHVETTIDDSSYHTTLTDYTVELRFQALEAPVALAPYIAVSAPSHSYETLGHAAPGTGLMKYSAGFFAGLTLHPWVPRTYLHGRASYTYLEPVAGVDHARTNVDLELGYFVSPRFAVRALGSLQEAHGGIDVPIPITHPLYQYHDQLGAESFLHVGAGVSFAFTEQVGVYATYLTSTRGRNGHKLEDGVSAGVSISHPCAFAKLGNAGDC